MADNRDITEVKKNIVLPAWAVFEFDYEAANQHNKCKRVMEFFLIEIASQKRDLRLKSKKKS